MKDWKEINNKLIKEFKFNSYLDGVDFVNQIANLAEIHNHHPEIQLNYKKVIVATTTHEAGYKITEKDEKLGKEVDSIFNKSFA